MNKSSEAYFFVLLSRKLAGEASAEELQSLEQMAAQSPEWQCLYLEMLKGNVHAAQEQQAEMAFAAHEAKMRLQGKLDTSGSSGEAGITPVVPVSRKRNKMLWVAITAAAVLVFLIVNPFWKTQHQHSQKINEIITQRGSKSKIKLADGTVVVLNADSKLSYPESFVSDTREVELIGEAYFSVAHDSAHPFIIHTGRLNIKVLGTEFNVKNYPQDDVIETALIRGKVEVSMVSNPSEKFILKPSEKIVVSKKKEEVHVDNATETARALYIQPISYGRTDSVVAETAWMQGKLVFVNETFGAIAKELERRFNITVVFEDETVKTYRYTAEFTDETAGEILEAMKLSKKFNYHIKDKTISIKK
ncbi:MAG: FecR domain-containing protein [Filimonas sp.]|nr:FecR domain-containing protein [Filimonas sp.]